MQLFISESGLVSPLTNVPVINLPLTSIDEERSFIKDDDGGIFEIKAVDLAPGSLFIGDYCSENGEPLICVQVHPEILKISFIELHRSLYELGLDESHKDMSRLQNSLNGMRKLGLFAGDQSLFQIFESSSAGKAVEWIKDNLFAEERLEKLALSKIYTKVAELPEFLSKWSIKKDDGKMKTAVALQILIDFLPIGLIEQLCKSLGLEKPLDTPIIRNKNTDVGDMKSAVPKKRNSKAAISDLKEPGQKITSFFKPKSALSK